MPSPCAGSQSIGSLTQNSTLASSDLYLVQKGSVYYKREHNDLVASQSEVNAGTDTKKFVTPATLSGAPRQDLGVFDTGFLQVDVQPADNETFTIDVAGTTVVFEFTSGGGATPGNIEVIKGGTTALTAAAWVTAINAQSFSFDALQDANITNKINWITQAAGLTVTLTDGTTGDVLYGQSTGVRTARNIVPFVIDYVLTAQDVTNDEITVRHQFTSILALQVYDAANTTTSSPWPCVNLIDITLSGSLIRVENTSTQYNMNNPTDIIRFQGLAEV